MENRVATNEDDYDPVAHRPEGRPLTTDFNALMHLMKCSVGTGILFLPNAFKRTGYVMSLVCSLLIGILCTSTVVNLVLCSQTLCKRHRIPMLDFARTAEVSFEKGPERIRKYSKIFRYVTYFASCFAHYQTSIVYILYVATSFQQVIEFFSGVALDKRIYILSLLPIAVGLGNLTTLRYLAPFSMIGFCFTFSGINIAIYYFLNGIPPISRLNTFTTALSVPMYCSLFLFAMHNTTYSLPLENSMEHPHRLPYLLTFSMAFNMCVYTTFGFFGYNKYADATCDTVIKNLPLEETLAQMVKIAIALSVMFSFGLAFFVIHKICWSLMESKYEGNKYAYPLIRTIVVLIAIIIAIAVPEMVPLLGFLASLSSTTIMLLIPTLIEMATKWEYASRLLLMKNIVTIIIWLFLLIFGAIQSLWTIILEYHDAKQEC